jgi:hypothetical protein
MIPHVFLERWYSYLDKILEDYLYGFAMNVKGE